MQVQGVTFDSSVVVAPTDRRFVLCSLERLGAKVPIVPAVAREMFGQLPTNETAHWARVLDGEESRKSASYTALARANIYEAVAEATRMWVRNELDAQIANPNTSPESGLSVVKMTAEQIVEAQRISMDIPEKCFRSLTPSRQLGDRNVMSQAAVLGFSVLASHNRHSILRPEVNKWMKEEIGLNHDLVQEADQVIYEIYEGEGLDPAIEQLKAVLLACLPSAVRAPMRQKEIIDQFLSRMERGSFRDCAARSARALSSDEFTQYVEEIRGELASSIARRTEDRRISLVRDAARGAGWSG